MKIGVLASPAISLSNVFFYDYHQLMRDLSFRHEIYLVGSVVKMPAYVEACLCLPPLISRTNFNFLGFLGYLRSHKLFKITGQKFVISAYIRRLLEIKFDDIMKDSAIIFFTKNDIDILYAFPFYPDLYPTEVAKALRIPLILEFWEDQICFNYESDLSKGLSAGASLKERMRGYFWLRKIVEPAEHVIVPSRVLEKRLASLGADDEKISRIPVCTHPFLQRNPDYIKFFHKLRKRKIVYYLGSMSPWHDLKCLIMAMGNLNYEDVVLIISGGSKYTFKKLDKYIKRIDKPVFYTGKLSPDEADYYISAADVCVAPYKLTYPSGFFPGAIVRYMLAGKAIVATNLPEIREMFKGLKAGILVRQNAPDEMARAIDFLLENDEEHYKIGEVTRRIAENNYLWKHHTEKLERILKHFA